MEDTLVKKPTVTEEKSPAKEARSVLDEVLLNGAREMLQRSIENEVADLKRHNRMTDEKGHRLAVSDGFGISRATMAFRRRAWCRSGFR